MATPTWDQLIRPVLELACKEPITRRSAKAHVYEVVPMTKQEKEERLKSGYLKVGNRVGWAMSHLTKAKLIEKVEKATYRATEAGVRFLEQHRGQDITYQTLKEVDGYLEAWKDASQRNQMAKKEDDFTPDSTSEGTPKETKPLILTRSRSLQLLCSFVHYNTRRIQFSCRPPLVPVFTPFPMRLASSGYR